MKRVFIVVLDSFGIGQAPDADEFGDNGSNTLEAVVQSGKFNCPVMKKLGLFNIDGVNCFEKEKSPMASFGKLVEISKGKDTTTGHWEMAGIVSKKPFPVFPQGFPKEIVARLEKAFGKGILCNKPYSGTQVIVDFGKEHLETGKPIVYTSADSVLQIACHEDVVPVEKLYEMCRKAREIMQGKFAVGRIIARPFKGEVGEFYRTTNRHDFSLVPPENNLLKILQIQQFDVISIGKIYDIFAGSGIDKSFPTKGNSEGLEKLLEMQKEDFNGLCFLNLCDFDMLYGHRNDVDGYANALSEADSYLGKFIEKMQEEDVLMIVADHGCDPSTKSTDHSRENVPCLVYSKKLQSKNMGTKKGFNHIGATVLKLLNAKEGNNKVLAEKFSLV